MEIFLAIRKVSGSQTCGEGKVEITDFFRDKFIDCDHGSLDFRVYCLLKAASTINWSGRLEQ